MVKSPIPCDISRIDRYAPAQLIGRKAETKLLVDAWKKAVRGAKKRPHILTFVALGGEGKTSLVARWVVDQQIGHWKDCDAAFAWSFYSQGSDEKTATSSDLFLKDALTFFGDPTMAGSAQGAFEKGRRLAQLVGDRRALLILDGLEPLQYSPTSPTPGELKDQGIAALLKGLAATSRGLCIVTTRYAVPNLGAYLGKTVREETLTRLDRAAGVQLLQSLGVKGSLRKDIRSPDGRELWNEFEKLVEDVKGHALTLNLLGTYLRDAHAGDIRKRDLVKLEEADAEEQSGHAFDVMNAYVRLLEGEASNTGGQRALAILRLMGLFDRPATADCLNALWKGEAIAGLTEPLIGISDAQRNFSLKRLEDAKLLTVNRTAGSGELVALDAHPLLQEYFAKRVRQQHPNAWRAAHRRVYEHLRDTTKEGTQPTLEDLQPLYQAVAHGCQAGLQQEACDKVYDDRITRGEEKYAVRKLGAFGSDLGAVACFFEAPWSRVSPALTEAAQAWLLNQAAYRLRALGRLTEALEPMRAGLENYVKQEDWEHAATTASNLSELELTLGEVARAVADAEQSVTHADRSGDAGQRRINRTTHADALHQAGRQAEAKMHFREAEQMQAKDQPSYPLLYSVQGFQYCDLFLTEAERAAWQLSISVSPAGSPGVPPGETGDETLPECAAKAATLRESCRAVSERAAQTLRESEADPGTALLDYALDHLTLGRAALYAAILEHSSLDVCRSSLDHAVAGLRSAGTQHHIPRGLLTRAWLRALTGPRIGPESAQADLDEAWEIAERGPMRLHMADIHLYRARLFFRDEHYPWESPQADLTEARRLIEKCGYWRRKEELEAAEKAISTRPTTPAALPPGPVAPPDPVPAAQTRPPTTASTPEAPMTKPGTPANHEFGPVIEKIAADRLEDALADLRARTQSGPRSLADRIVMQSGRLTRNTQAARERRLSREDAEVERIRIAEALLGLVRELEQATPQPVKEVGVTDTEVLYVLRQLEAGLAKGRTAQPNRFEAVHGANNLKSISWIELGVRASRSVCRVLVTSSTGAIADFGTGFLVAPGRVMTNNHVIDSIAKAKGAKIEFNYQLSPDASTDPTVRYDLDPDTFFHPDPANKLDYTVVAVRPDANKPPLEKWGTLVLNAHADPLADELVTIIQHPNGQVKQVVLTASRIVQAKTPLLHYTSDTMPGSSGSPVFNDLWQVIAIHHRAGPTIGGVATNEGILMSAIRPNLGANWPGK